jgi:tRNA threonylcarbamoyladenosine biosynthesis protein TsaE
MIELSWLARSAQDMERFGAALADGLPRLRDGPAVLFLAGELGAGKTTLARGFLTRRGHAGAVRSPTFTLLERYALGDLVVVHVDLYRLRDASELDALDLRDFALPDHVWLIEWPERGAGALPEPDVHVALRVAPEAHPAHARAGSPLGEAWLAAAADAAGMEPAGTRTRGAGGARAG